MHPGASVLFRAGSSIWVRLDAFFREALSGWSSLVNANIICAMTPHRAQWLGAGDREAMGRRAMFLAATIEGCQPPPVNSWCWGKNLVSTQG